MPKYSKADLLHKTSILENQIGLDSELMCLLLYMKAERRKLKDRNFYCVAVDMSNTKIELYVNKKFQTEEKFVTTLKGEKVLANQFTFLLASIRKIQTDDSELTQPKHVQVLIKNGAHWTCVDFLINTDKSISIFLLDAAGDRRWIEIIMSINKILDHPTIYVCTGKIQFDKIHCGWFSLFYAYKLSNFGLSFFEYLKSLQPLLEQNNSGLFSKNPLYIVDVQKLPARLIAPIQCQDILTDYLEHNPELTDCPVTKGKKLSELFGLFREIQTPSGAYRLTNPVILDFKAKQINYLKNFLLANDDLKINNVIRVHLHMLINTLKKEIEEKSGKYAI